MFFQPDKREFPIRREDGLPMEGWHGFDNNNKDMMALFVGMGPGVCLCVCVWLAGWLAVLLFCLFMCACARVCVYLRAYAKV